MLIRNTEYKYVERNVSRHGSARFYFRGPDGKRVRLPDPSTDLNGFLADHAAMMRVLAGDDEPMPPRRRKSTIKTVMDSTISPRAFEPMVWGARTRSGRKGVPFELNISWAHRTYLEQGGQCAVSGIDMTMPSRGMKQSPYQVSIDRIRPSLGYTEDNCRLVILAVNLAMNVWGEKTFKDLAHRIAAKTLIGAI